MISLKQLKAKKRIKTIAKYSYGIIFSEKYNLSEETDVKKIYK